MKIAESSKLQSLAAERVMKTIQHDRDELVELCLKLSGIPSSHSKERPVAEAVVNWFTEKRIPSHLQPITFDSSNAVGRISGTGNGRSLIFDAHIDTGRTELLGRGEYASRMENGFAEGDMIFGRGIVNCKAQVAAFMIAAAALLKSGIKLNGDLIVAAVAFETGAPSVDEFQGIDFPGSGFGTRWLIDRGVIADYALVGETSGFGIVSVECGLALYRIRVQGRMIYTPRLERTTGEQPSAYVKAASVVLALEEWALAYEKRETIAFEGGNIIPRAQIKGIRGSTKSGMEGRDCFIYLEVFLKPGANALTILREIKRVAGDCDVSLYQWSRGYFAKNAEPLIESVKGAHRTVFEGSNPPLPSSPEVSMWRDLNAFNEANIPSICYGPPRQFENYSDAQDRAMKISDLVATTKVYALTALTICEVAECQ